MDSKIPVFFHKGSNLGRKESTQDFQFLGCCQLMNVSFKGHFDGSKVGGREEGESEGNSKIGSSEKVAEGLRKWAGLIDGLWSPMGGTISSSLNLKMVFSGSVIVAGEEKFGNLDSNVDLW